MQNKVPRMHALAGVTASATREEEGMIDWPSLICSFCRRKFKDDFTLRRSAAEAAQCAHAVIHRMRNGRHIESSELHSANVTGWRTARTVCTASSSNATHP